MGLWPELWKRRYRNNPSLHDWKQRTISGDLRSYETMYTPIPSITSTENCTWPWRTLGTYADSEKTHEAILAGDVERRKGIYIRLFEVYRAWSSSGIVPRRAVGHWLHWPISKAWNPKHLQPYPYDHWLYLTIHLCILLHHRQFTRSNTMLEGTLLHVEIPIAICPDPGSHFGLEICTFVESQGTVNLKWQFFLILYMWAWPVS